MRIKNGYILRKIANTDMVVPIGGNIADFNGVITLNESAAFLWRQLQKEIEFPSLVEALAEEYSISSQQAKEDIQEFLARLKKAEILQAD